LKRSEFENEFESSSESEGRTTRRNVARNDVRGINTSTCQTCRYNWRHGYSSNSCMCSYASLK
ncbi:MAG: hypothetical protein ACJ8MO_19710, partial [Bacillus sp. (in: firmicutes)]